MLVSTESILIVNSNLPDKVTWNLVTNSIEKSAEQLFWQKKGCNYSTFSSLQRKFHQTLHFCLRLNLFRNVYLLIPFSNFRFM